MKLGTIDYEYQSEFARKYFFEGREQGRAAAVLDVLDARGFDIPDEVRARVAACTDLEQLTKWTRRAVVIDDVAELFEA